MCSGLRQIAFGLFALGLGACGSVTSTGVPIRGIYRGVLRLDGRTTCTVQACSQGTSLSLTVSENNEGFWVRTSSGQVFAAAAQGDTLRWQHDRPVHQVRCEGNVHGTVELSPAFASGDASLLLVATPSCDGTGADSCTCAYKGIVDRF